MDKLEGIVEISVSFAENHSCDDSCDWSCDGCDDVDCGGCEAGD